MNTRVLQTLSTAFFGACGIVALFAPEVFLGAISMANVTPHWPVQILAAALLALAIFNWRTRGFTVGGIYGRPVALTNFTFFFVAAMSTVRPVLAGGRPGPIGVLVICGIFAIAYGLLVFGRGPADTASRK
jgi:hypothetical protein